MRNHETIYIDGQWVAPVDPKRLELISPTTENPIASVCLASARDVDLAVKAARKAFPSFSETSKEERIALFERIIEVYQARQKDLMAAITLEMGSPKSQVIMTQAALQGFQQAITTLRGYNFEVQEGVNVIRREPIGVCGLITAWNWPVQILCTKLSSAFAAGCTVVAKPSEFTPLSAIILTEILDAAGVPPGVFNLVIGDGPTVGHAISTHPDIDLVSFTGSTRAGVQVAQAAAASVKRVCQELGGKSANIVLPDADLRQAAQWNIARCFSNSGQSCHAPSRMLVHEDQLDQAIDLLCEEVKKIKVGDPEDASTTLGPVVNKAQFDRVQMYIQKGVDEGARLVCGGLGRPPELTSGYFVKPTVFADVKPEMTIAKEEIFGPVLAVMPYRSIEQALEIANGTRYGLGAYVFTSDRKTGHEVGSRMRAGRVFLNGVASNPAAPMGGYKQSGNGREMGVFGLEEYLEVKAMIGFVDR
jgi:aldehyde dehydrogenase (NAD+)